MSTALAEIRDNITKLAPQFKAALPAHVPVERFTRTIMTAVQTTPALLEADRRTFYAACTKAAQAGLLPDGREGAIVTFKGQAQWMPMVAGIMKLVRNSGEISTWSVQAVYENDHFDYELGDEEHIKHKPALTNRGKMIGAYSIVTMKDGEKSREFMSCDDINAIRSRSRSGDKGPWVSDYAEMAKKTVVRRHSKRLPMSTDLDQIFKEDDELFGAADIQQESEEPAQPAQPAQAAAPKQRATRMAQVVQKAAPQPEPAQHDDNIIEGEATTIEEPPAHMNDEPAQGGEHDSPI